MKIVKSFKKKKNVTVLRAKNSFFFLFVDRLGDDLELNF